RPWGIRLMGKIRELNRSKSAVNIPNSLYECLSQIILIGIWSVINRILMAIARIQVGKTHVMVGYAIKDWTIPILLEGMIKAADHGPELPRLDRLIDERFACKRKIPAMSEIDQFLKLHWGQRFIGIASDRDEFISDGSSRISHKKRRGFRLELPSIS